MSPNTSLLAEPLLQNNSELEQRSQSNSLQPPQSNLPLESSTKSRNINLVLAYTFFTFSARSLWNQSVLSAFVYLLKSNDPKYVGFLTGLMGMAQLLTSFPSGWLADKYRRDTMLKWGSVIGFVAAISTFIASRMNSFSLLGMSLAIWGLFWGVCNTSVMALFADSIPDGDRSYYFMQRMLLQYFGNTFGPATALLMFTRLGDEWTLGECSVVIGAGQVLSIPALILLCFMNDDYCIQDKEETSCGDQDEYSVINTDSTHTDGSNVVDDASDEECVSEERDHEEHASLVDRADSGDVNSQDRTDFFCIPTNRVVPVLVSFADILSGLAAGMSIRYFPIFFIDNLQLNPAQVQIIFIVAMLSMAVTGRTAQWVGTKIGRVQTTVICKWIGALLLMAMISSHQNGVAPLYVCILFVLRTASMNAPGALTRSVLMDHVPKEERGKWSALESVNMFSWAGSAALGGILVDLEGILFNFKMTAGFQLVATIPLMMIFGRVRSEN
jgi:MFS family permease